MRDARHALSLLIPSGVAAAVGAAVRPGDLGDLPYFVHAAERMLSRSWADTYADSTLQVGPLQLVAFGVLREPRAIGAAVGATAVVLFWLVARRLLAGRGGYWALLLASLTAVALGLTFDAYRDGHPAQVLAPLLWVLAGLDLRDGRAARAGLLVGASAALELWGLLGLALIVVAPDARTAIRAAATATATVAACFLPFVLAGDFGMFEYRWRVNGDTLLSLAIEPGTAFTWQLRLLQGGLALLAGALVATLCRRSRAALWAGPLAIVCVRLALDPVRYSWYWLALETVALVGALQLAGVLRLTASDGRRRLAFR